MMNIKCFKRSPDFYLKKQMSSMKIISIQRNPDKIFVAELCLSSGPVEHWSL